MLHTIESSAGPYTHLMDWLPFGDFHFAMHPSSLGLVILEQHELHARMFGCRTAVSVLDRESVPHHVCSLSARDSEVRTLHLGPARRSPADRRKLRADLEHA